MTTALRPELRLHAPSRFALAAASQAKSFLQDDGTVWTHAASFGTYVYGDAIFTLSAADFRNMKAVFEGGYPQKAPVDYEHETEDKRKAQTTAVPWTRSAGQIIELAIVEAEAELNDAQRAQVEAERAHRAKVGNAKPVDPTGLWMRWEPTARALQLVRDREVTETSITFHPDFPHNQTGEGQGPTLLSVALTSTPFLDSMTPVAASRGAGGDRPVSPEHKETDTMSTQNRFALAVAVLLGRTTPFSTDQEAQDAATARITELSREVDGMKAHKLTVDAIASEVGETDPAKLALAVRALKSKAGEAERAAADARKTSLSAQVEGFLKDQEAKIGSKPMRDLFATNLTRELEAGATLENAPTAVALKGAPKATSLGQHSQSDEGKDAPSRDKAIALKAAELRTADPKLAYEDSVVLARKHVDEAGK